MILLRDLEFQSNCSPFFGWMFFLQEHHGVNQIAFEMLILLFISIFICFNRCSTLFSFVFCSTKRFINLFPFTKFKCCGCKAGIVLPSDDADHLKVDFVCVATVRSVFVSQKMCPTTSENIIV